MNNLASAYEDKNSSYFSNDRREMLSFIPPEVTNLLEIGCGNGSFGALLKESRRVEVTGVESFAAAAVRARRVLDRVLESDIERADLEIPHGYFDCITYNDVLEHLHDPWTTVSRFAQYLRPGGYVVASIPNIRYFDAFKSLLVNKDWIYQSEGVLDRTHLRFFTEKSIARLFEESGFEVLRLQGINGRPFPWKFRVLNFLCGHRFDDVRFRQFACVARRLAT